MNHPSERLDFTTGLDGQVRIRTVFSRSINLARDTESLDLVRSYVPTSRAIQALEQVVAGLAPGPRSRALALIGPYGAGKSAFGQFLGALVSPPDSLLRQAALSTLAGAEPRVAALVRDTLSSPRGLLRVPVNGIPDSLVRQLMLALAAAAERYGLKDTLVNRVRGIARPGATMNGVLDCIAQVRDAWSALGGGGLLIEIDELGKFLEYESYHPEHRELHLLQLLAERGALRWHRVLTPEVRHFLWVFPAHWSAVIEEVAAADTAPQQFVVDSWFVNNGEPAVILPLADWKKGAGPDV